MKKAPPVQSGDAAIDVRKGDALAPVSSVRNGPRVTLAQPGVVAAAGSVRKSMITHAAAVWKSRAAGEGGTGFLLTFGAA